jgi:phosphotriesterase-related protein
VTARDLGRTMIHEHIFISLICYWAPEQNPTIAYEPVTLERLGDIRADPAACRHNLYLDDPKTALSELIRYRTVGGSTIVELSTSGIGRDPRALAWVSEKSEVNVVAGCGYYIRPSHPPGLETRSTDSLVQDMVLDLTEGIDGTKIRAGIIGEIGMATCPMDPSERRVLEAAARAQQMTGVGIITHSAPGTESAFEVADVLTKGGADMTRVVISHLDDRFGTDLDMYKRLAASGVRLGLDTFGREVYFKARRRQHPSDDVRIDTVCRLVEAGLSRQIMLSQDICSRHELAFYGGHGYAHILRNIVPRLRDRGLSDAEIDSLLVDNPAYVLSGLDGRGVPVRDSLAT